MGREGDRETGKAQAGDEALNDQCPGLRRSDRKVTGGGPSRANLLQILAHLLQVVGMTLKNVASSLFPQFFTEAVAIMWRICITQSWLNDGEFLEESHFWAILAKTAIRPWRQRYVPRSEAGGRRAGRTARAAARERGAAVK